MQTITVLPESVDLLEFMSLEPGIRKRYEYYQNIKDRTYSDANLLIKDDNVIHYAYNVYKIKRSKDGYYRQKTKRQGFTLEDGKLSVWFGGIINNMPYILEVLKHLNKEWYNGDLNGILTKGLFQKVLNGKITNPVDYAKAYIKQMRLKCSHKLLLEVVQKHSMHSSQIHAANQIAKDLNHYFEHVINKAADNSVDYMLPDFERQAMILDRKIDYTWSRKRMELEHTQWTMDIMELEISDLTDEPLEWLQPMHDMLPNANFTLLDTQKKVFAEGKIMNHCVYTNYWKSIKHCRYAAISVEFFGEKATLGLTIHRHNISFAQMYGKYNQAVSKDLTVYVQNWIADLNARNAVKEIFHPVPASTEVEEQHLLIGEEYDLPY